MKILKDNEFKALKEKAENYDAVVAAVVEAGENLSADDVTPQSILEAMENTQADALPAPDASQIEELNSRIDALTGERDTAIARAENAEARIAELEQLPAAPTAGSKAPQNDNSESSLEELNEFAKARKNDQPAVIEKIRESGIL